MKTVRLPSARSPSFWANFFGGLVGLLILVAPAPGAESEARLGLDLQPCGLDSGGEDFLCGTLEVFEDRLRKKGRKIPLRVLVMPSQKGLRSERALFLLAGGPGVAASRWGPGFVASALQDLRQTHDVILVDQRGTGESNSLRCSLFEPGDLQAMWGDLFPLEPLQRCRRNLEDRADLGLYGTTLAMDDLDEVRAALGYAKIDLYGSSYGTQAALVYLRRHPQNVRSVVLQGVAPPSARGLEEIPKAAQAALDRLLDLCQTDRTCHDAYPEIRTELSAVLDRLRSGPLRVQVSPPGGGEPVALNLTYDNFTLVLRGLLHHAPAAARIPFLIHTAAAGNFEPFAAAAFGYRGRIGAGLAVGMFLSVFCEEQVRRTDLEAAARSAKDSFVGDSWTTQLVRACGIWPQGQIPEGYAQPVRSQVPVLLLAGELDPATPPSWAHQAATHLPNSRVLELPYTSHSLAQSEGCADRLAVEFLRRGSAEALDTSCGEKLSPAPFFVP